MQTIQIHSHISKFSSNFSKPGRPLPFIHKKAIRYFHLYPEYEILTIVSLREEFESWKRIFSFPENLTDKQGYYCCYPLNGVSNLGMKLRFGIGTFVFFNIAFGI